MGEFKGKSMGNHGGCTVVPVVPSIRFWDTSTNEFNGYDSVDIGMMIDGLKDLAHFRI